MQKASQKKNTKKSTAKTAGRKAPAGPVTSNKGRRVDPPLVFTQKTQTKPPQISRGQQACLIRHSEFLGPISTSVNGFSLLKRYRINAASEQTFPWLSAQAIQWEQYRFRMLRFRYLPRCGSATQVSLMISPDYDAADGVPPTETVMCQHVDTVENSAFVPLDCVLDPARLNRAYKAHFCMGDARFANTEQDEKTIDAAQVHIACDAATTFAGKLWVDYVVELITPAAVTEAVNQGGAKLNYVAQGLAGPPVLNVVGANVQETDPIISTVNAIGTSNIGTLLRDWSGILSSTGVSGSSGTTAATAPTISVLRKGATIPLPQLNLVQTTNGYEQTVGINGLAGDILQMVGGNPPGSTSWGSVLNQFGGASPSTF